MRITVADFVELLPFSKQIEPAKVEPAIEKALLLDVRPLVPADLLEEVERQPVPVITPFVLPLAGNQPNTASLLAGAYASRRERVYQVLYNNPTELVPIAGEASAQWLYVEALTLWQFYLKPYWVAAAYARFLPTHGYNLEKAGLTMPADPEGTYQPAGSTHRAALQSEADNTASALHARLARFLREHLPSNPNHCGNQAQRRKGRIRGI